MRYKLQKFVVRRWLLDDGKRVDGRKLDEIRPLSAEVGLIPRVHGSALFTRGQTQALTITTLGAVSEAQILDGIGSEDRKRYGLCLNLSIADNTVLPSLQQLFKGPFVNDRAAHRHAQDYVEKIRTKTPSTRARVGSLSGGNQQKVIIGRWLLTAPEILLLDEPTRGIDVGAKYEIYQLILDLAKEGKGVIVVSSEMPELLGICDRILVMSNGILAGEVDARSTSQEEILTLAAKYV